MLDIEWHVDEYGASMTIYHFERALLPSKLKARIKFDIDIKWLYRQWSLEKIAHDFLFRVITSWVFSVMPIKNNTSAYKRAISSKMLHFYRMS